MRILFARPGPFPPELYAGTELTLYWLCRRLMANGHEVMLASQSEMRPKFSPAMDHECGFPVMRARSIMTAVQLAAENFHPDVFVFTESGEWNGWVMPFVGDAPIVIYENEIGASMLKVPEDIRARAVYIANSKATSDALMKHLGISAPIVPPLFGVGRYADIKPNGNRVLFVSLQRRKGSDVAIRIAESRPRIPFVFVESWTEKPERTQFLREYVRKIPNITLLPNQPSLDNVLPHIKLLLMPSRSDEAWGRMVTEAQICGIPVLGSRRGNLPITIGDGGVTFDPDEPIERWLAAFDRIMGDGAFYEDLSHKARAHGRAKIEDTNRSYEAFMRALHEARARQAA